MHNRASHQAGSASGEDAWALEVAGTEAGSPGWASWVCCSRARRLLWREPRAQTAGSGVSVFIGASALAAVAKQRTSVALQDTQRRKRDMGRSFGERGRRSARKHGREAIVWGRLLEKIEVHARGARLPRCI